MMHCMRQQSTQGYQGSWVTQASNSAALAHDDTCDFCGYHWAGFSRRKYLKMITEVQKIGANHFSRAILDPFKLIS